MKEATGGQFVRVFNASNCPQGVGRIGPVKIYPGHTVAIPAEEARVLRDNPNEYPWVQFMDAIPEPEATHSEVASAGRAGQMTEVETQGDTDVVEVDEELKGYPGGGPDIQDQVDYHGILAMGVRQLKTGVLGAFTLHQLNKMVSLETAMQNRGTVLQLLNDEIKKREETEE